MNALNEEAPRHHSHHKADAQYHSGVIDLHRLSLRFLQDLVVEVVGRRLGLVVQTPHRHPQPRLHLPHSRQQPLRHLSLLLLASYHPLRKIGGLEGGALHLVEGVGEGGEAGGFGLRCYCFGLSMDRSERSKILQVYQT